MIRAEGYVAETHYVETDDGYVLALHRIPYGKEGRGDSKADRPVVFLQHGLLCSSADWVMASPSKVPVAWAPLLISSLCYGQSLLGMCSMGSSAHQLTGSWPAPLRYVVQHGLLCSSAD